jgi:hypothetical protein
MEQDLMRKDEEIEQLKKVTNDVRQVRMMMGWQRRTNGTYLVG